MDKSVIYDLIYYWKGINLTTSGRVIHLAHLIRLRFIPIWTVEIFACHTKHLVLLEQFFIRSIIMIFSLTALPLAGLLFLLIPAWRRIYEQTWPCEPTPRAETGCPLTVLARWRKLCISCNSKLFIIDLVRSIRGLHIVYSAYVLKIDSRMRGKLEFAVWRLCP